MANGICMVCGEDLGYEPQMCCSGHQCGCMGMPVDPPICSKECHEEWDWKRELETIIGGSFYWIKVKRFQEPKEMDNPKAIIDWKFAYQSLNDHHKKETEFLIEKCKELAKQLLDGGYKRTGTGEE
jgi:hypothetical protein